MLYEVITQCRAGQRRRGRRPAGHAVAGERRHRRRHPARCRRDLAFRITSYNVCYTKLLRADFSYYTNRVVPFIKSIGIIPKYLSAREIRIEQETEPIIVITSYSIHYTKLYEINICICLDV